MAKRYSGVFQPEQTDDFDLGTAQYQSNQSVSTPSWDGDFELQNDFNIFSNGDSQNDDLSLVLEQSQYQQLSSPSRYNGSLLQDNVEASYQPYLPQQPMPDQDYYQFGHQDAQPARFTYNHTVVPPQQDLVNPTEDPFGGIDESAIQEYLSTSSVQYPSYQNQGLFTAVDQPFDQNQLDRDLAGIDMDLSLFQPHISGSPYQMYRQMNDDGFQLDGDLAAREGPQYQACIPPKSGQKSRPSPSSPSPSSASTIKDEFRHSPGLGRGPRQFRDPDISTEGPFCWRRQRLPSPTPRHLPASDGNSRAAEWLRTRQVKHDHLHDHAFTSFFFFVFFPFFLRRVWISILTFQLPSLLGLLTKSRSVVVGARRRLHRPPYRLVSV